MFKIWNKEKEDKNVYFRLDKGETDMITLRIVDEAGVTIKSILSITSDGIWRYPLGDSSDLFQRNEDGMIRIKR